MNWDTIKFIAINAIGGAIFLAICASLLWLYCAVTPDQLSAECDCLKEQCK